MLFGGGAGTASKFNSDTHKTTQTHVLFSIICQYNKTYSVESIYAITMFSR